MNPLITNRSAAGAWKLPADGWHEIEVRGDHPNAQAGIIQVIDDLAITAIHNRFQAAKTEAGADWPGILVDRDHESLDQEKSTRAAGWLIDTRVNNRGNLEGLIKWTTSGRADVEGGEFRYFSTVYDPEAFETVANRSDKALRPVALSRLALTNDPNNKGGRPISNRQHAGTNNNPEPKGKPMKSIAELLGLPAEAPEADILAAIKALQEKGAAPAEPKSPETPEQMVANRNTIADLQGKLADADLAQFEGRFDPASKEQLRQGLITNRDATLAILKMLPERDAAKAKPAGPVINRKDGKTPKEPTEAKPEDADAVKNRRARANAMAKRDGIAFRDAWDACAD